MATSKPKSRTLARRRAVPPRKKSLRVAIVGAGRLGTALGIGLAASGVTIVATVCRRLGHALTAARLIGEDVVPLTAKQLSKLPEFDVAIIATPDDAIVATARSLAGAAPVAGRVVLHVSGSLPSTNMRPVFPLSVAVGSMHPLLAISDPRVGAVGLRSAFFSIEGELDALKAARHLVRALGARVVPIRTERKALYHAAAVMAAGHIVALFDQATKLMKLSGPDHETATAMLATLFRSATEAIDRKAPTALMTGPFARGDVDTIESHLLALASKDLEPALSIYLSLGAHAIALAEEAGLDPATARGIRKVLSKRNQS